MTGGILALGDLPPFLTTPAPRPTSGSLSAARTRMVLVAGSNGKISRKNLLKNDTQVNAE